MSDLSLHGDKVHVRRFTPADIDDRYIGWLNDPVVTRFSNQRFFTHDRQSCERYHQSFEGTTNLFLSVRTARDDRAIGTMTAYLQLHHGTVDVGIMIGERQNWGGGYGREAWGLVVEWLLGRPDIRKVTAGTLACNKPMLRLIERSGMTFEGARRAQEIVEGRPEDILLFARFA